MRRLDGAPNPVGCKNVLIEIPSLSHTPIEKNPTNGNANRPPQAGWRAGLESVDAIFPIRFGALCAPTKMILSLVPKKIYGIIIFCVSRLFLAYSTPKVKRRCMKWKGEVSKSSRSIPAFLEQKAGIFECRYPARQGVDTPGKWRR